jgi:putative mycofactocin binding protein MftB
MASRVVTTDQDAGHGEGEAPPAASFDLDAAWQLHPQVSVRPERFGALLYHFGTRRLSFCKNVTLATVIRSLGDAPSARSACLAAGIGDAELPTYRLALATLAASSTIVASDTVLAGGE